MKITGAVRVIKGQEVLPDGSTLDEHGIIDGSTVNIIIEPEKEINLQIKLGPKVFSRKLLNSVRVRELKQQLIDGGNVGFLINEFQLVSFSTWYKITLEDESLPLHLYGVGDNTTLRAMGGRVTIKLVNQKGAIWYKTFSKSITVAQMKQTILSTDTFFSADEERNLVKDIWLFVNQGDSYRELDDEATIGEIISNDDTVYFIEDRFFPETAMILVNLLPIGKEIGSVGCSIEDTVLSVKLRVQAQFGFPVSHVYVVQGFRFLKNNETIRTDIDCIISVE